MERRRPEAPDSSGSAPASSSRARKVSSSSAASPVSPGSAPLAVVAGVVGNAVVPARRIDRGRTCPKGGVDQRYLVDGLLTALVQELDEIRHGLLKRLSLPAEILDRGEALLANLLDGQAGLGCGDLGHGAAGVGDELLERVGHLVQVGVHLRGVVAAEPFGELCLTQRPRRQFHPANRSARQ